MSREDSYSQFCPLAAGLDVIGNPSTLVMIRELLIADGDLAGLSARLPGIAPDELRDRLDLLVKDGVVAKDAGRYHLTDVGERLRQPLLDLAHWGETLTRRG